MSKHSKGPWKLHLVDDCTVIDATGKEVACICGDYNHPDTWPMMEANAALIAAAPELLDGCNALLGLIDLVCDRDDMPPEIRKALQTSHRAEEAKSAVAKAEAPS